MAKTNIATSDALSEMNAELQKPDNLSSDPVSALTQMQEQTDMSEQSMSVYPEFEMNSESMLKVFREIDMLMADFLHIMKNVDKSFAQYAEIFDRQANKLAEKKKLTEEEGYELIGNIVVGTGIKAVGNAINMIRTTAKLAEVKRLLRDEAEVKIGVVKDLTQLMPRLVDAAESNFSRCEVGMPETYPFFKTLRSTVYNQRLVEFLLLTYEAALKGKFQDACEYPSMGVLNHDLLYGYLMGGEAPAEMGSDNRSSDKTQVIYSLIDQLKNGISNNSTVSMAAYILACDDELMSLSIYDANPFDGTTHWKDKDEMTLESEEYYEPFEELYITADTNSNNPLAKDVLNNNSLLELLGHYFKIGATREAYTSSFGTISIGWLLIVAAGFLVAWVQFDLKWYWCLLCALGMGILGFFLLPITSLGEKATEKIDLIERNIQSSSKQRAGFVKRINLAKVESSNSSRFLYAIVGGLIGIIGGPIGIIAGIIIGLVLGGSSDADEEDYSYDHIVVKTSKKLKFFLMLVFALDIYMLYRMIF